ncbi:prepilin-type N-terminal cleavage/methylation domain-containing protein [Wohlfahrtiimonas larvae]|uniref:Prepilin-type N-terminal cleavage/methylation domain-containing protein n=1 Tax=Wohlfahrtiimonas larvae TaxID=1157986 RepID=A0ABP9MTG9_9GAMM|nr:prepilin-type N-terminal cleavage/methylation domain-containing protein [Wohlfahrtiimonas larvae]
MMKDNFTLVELLIVLILIGILGMVAVPINHKMDQSIISHQESYVVQVEYQPESEVDIK